MASQSQTPNTSLCPSRTILAQLAVGQLSPVDLECWAGHVEICGQCQATLSEICVPDTLSDAMRESGRSPDTLQDPIVQALMDRLQEGGGGEVTADASSPAATAPLADDFSFLAPAES